MDQEELTRAIQKNKQIWNQRMKFPTENNQVARTNECIPQFWQMQTDVPSGDYNGLSEQQMHMMVNFPFASGCPVQLLPLSREQVDNIPLMRQAYYLLNALCKKDIRLTTNGYLPPSKVQELYELGNNNDSFYLKYGKKIESIVHDVSMLHITLEKTGLVQKSSNRLSITDKGRELLSDHNSLLQTILTFLFRDFDTGWMDLYDDNKVGNVGRLYSLWLLHHFGKNYRLYKFYVKNYFKAFPFIDGEELLAQEMYFSRVFKRLFTYLGLCVVSPKGGYESAWKTPLLDVMFTFEEPAKI